MPQALFFLKNQCVGESTLPNLNLPYQSQAFFCGTCGEIWGRIVVTPSSSWLLQHTPCEKHPVLGVIDWGKIPGSFLNACAAGELLPKMITANAQKYLPSQLLSREMLLLLKDYDDRNNASSLWTEDSP